MTEQKTTQEVKAGRFAGTLFWLFFLAALLTVLGHDRRPASSGGVYAAVFGLVLGLLPFLLIGGNAWIARTPLAEHWRGLSTRLKVLAGLFIWVPLAMAVKSVLLLAWIFFPDSRIMAPIFIAMKIVTLLAFTAAITLKDGREEPAIEQTIESQGGCQSCGRGWPAWKNEEAAVSCDQCGRRRAVLNIFGVLLLTVMMVFVVLSMIDAARAMLDLLDTLFG